MTTTPTKGLLRVWGNKVLPERFTTVPVTNGSTYAYRSIISVGVSDIQPGDIFEFYAGFEVRCPHDYTTMVCCYQTVSDGADNVNGVLIGEENGKNIVSGMPKYETRDRTAIWEADDCYPFRFFNLVVYSASSAAQPGAVIDVMQGYGRGYVKHFR